MLACSACRSCSAMQRDIPECGYERLLKLSLHAANYVIGPVPGHGWPIGSLLDQGRENVGNRQHSDEVRYTGRTEPVGISASIEIFVMMPYRIKDFRGNSSVAFQYIISSRGMGFDQRTFLGIQMPRLIQDRERNLRLADVVKHCR